MKKKNRVRGGGGVVGVVGGGGGWSKCLPYNVYFQNARTSQSVSVVGSMVEIKLLVVCHVAVVSNIVGGEL